MVSLEHLLASEVKNGAKCQQSRLELLISVFRDTFSAAYQVDIRGGGDEPFYSPSDLQSPALITFRSDYLSSALHEIAHWTLAGEERRQQEDYGYWYSPDGRDEIQQKRFEAAEVKPQALEWVYARACGHRFSVSVDNLALRHWSSASFKDRVHEQVQRYCQQGLPARARDFSLALAKAFEQANPTNPLMYARHQLD